MGLRITLCQNIGASMTVGVAWTRTINSCEELIFVTDSRLSGDGRNFNACPKVLTLPRSDCAIAFAGYTGHAYPMMQQLALAIDAHAPLKRRSLDLTSLKSHALKIFDSMRQQISVSPHLNGLMSTDPDAEFILGGFDWIKKDFEVWTIRYQPALTRFEAHPSQTLIHLVEHDRVVLSRSRRPQRGTLLGRIAFAGDQGLLARRNLLSKLNAAGRKTTSKLDWEPFEVVRDMLRDPAHSETIGGAPQIVKVYQYMVSTPLAVFWPTKKTGTIHLQGRECLGYERIEHFVLDPDTLHSKAPVYPRTVREQTTEPESEAKPEM
jgi:hypothetical protein